MYLCEIIRFGDCIAILVDWMIYCANVVFLYCYEGRFFCVDDKHVIIYWKGGAIAGMHFVLLPLALASYLARLIA